MFESIVDRPAKSVPGLILLGGTVAAQVGALAAAIVGAPLAFAIAVVVGVAFDLAGHEMAAVRTLFARAQNGLALRSLVRELSFIVLAARLVDSDALLFTAAAVATTSVPLVRGGALFLRTPFDRRTRQPVQTLNIEISGQAVHPVPQFPRLQTQIAAATPILVVGAWSLTSHVWWPFFALAGLYVAAFAVLIARLAWAIAAVRDNPSDRQATRLINAAVQARKPRAVLYFSGSRTSTYQLNMWLSTMERIGQEVLVIIRERAHLAGLAQTTLPVVVIPRSVDLMDFRLPTVRVAFYVAHVGKNIHLLREPRMKHVFIGHGESDKVASINPFTKVCDEVWVAGPASRERWHRAQVGVRDEAVVEVGRPQLGGIEGPTPRTGRPLSVLYAPTWEGWTDDPFVSSCASMGPAIVRWLLDRPDTRVIYKPHPLTGTVSRETRLKNDEIMTAIRHSGNYAELPDSPTIATLDDLADRDLVVTGNAPDLYECFNLADVLIGDISSVVPDFLASNKPYLMPNPGNRDHRALRDELASTRGGYLIDRSPNGWEAALADAAGCDTLGPDRAGLRSYLLGPRVDDPVEPWRVALSRLIATADAQWPHAAAESAALEHE
ncbi:MAG: CDP-glycerol glycerophosphotransferase family protein [Dermatophilaceae bacterium]